MRPEFNKTRGGNARNTRTTFPAKERRRREAAERQEAYDKLSPGAKVDLAGNKQLHKFAAGKDEELAQLAKSKLEQIGKDAPAL